MRRLFCSLQNICGDKIIVSDKSQVRHIRDALRLKVRDKIIIFDEQGNEYGCVIERVQDKVCLGINARYPPSVKKDKVEITVACAVPKTKWTGLLINLRN